MPEIFEIYNEAEQLKDQGKTDDAVRLRVKACDVLDAHCFTGFGSRKTLTHQKKKIALENVKLKCFRKFLKHLKQYFCHANICP